MMAPAAPVPAPWSELVPELLDLVIARIPHARDRARFRAVCRSWRSARAPRQLPWLVNEGHLVQLRSYTQDQEDNRRFIPGFEPATQLPKFLSSALRFISTTCADLVMSLADNKPWVAPGFLFSGSLCPSHEQCIGSTDGWLAIKTIDSKKKHTYYLQNVFSKIRVSLPELEPVIGNVSRLFRIYKVLVRSTPDDLVAVMTNNWNYPIILVRPGKGLWLPKPQKSPFIHIIDIVFLEDKLYAVTLTEGLISLQIAFNNHGKPMVTRVKRVIMSRIDDHPRIEYGNEEEAEIRRTTGDGMVDNGVRLFHPADDNEVSSDDVVVLFRYLVESRGKLLMVRRKLRYPKYRPGCPISVNHKVTTKVEIFKANTNARIWMPLPSGLGGQALFISQRFSKSILACGEVEEDNIYMNDTYEVFNTRSKHISAPVIYAGFMQSSWVFPPGFF